MMLLHYSSFERICIVTATVVTHDSDGVRGLYARAMACEDVDLGGRAHTNNLTTPQHVDANEVSCCLTGRDWWQKVATPEGEQPVARTEPSSSYCR